MNNNKKKLKIFVCATEQSGDNIGDKVISELKKIYPSILIDGVGGDKMNLNMNLQFFSIKDFKSMGLVEVFLSIIKYYKMINFLSKKITDNRYDMVITIDSPDFNYPLSKKIKNDGYKKKIIQIVAPTVWAWRPGRAKKFSKIYDLIFTLFDFENKFFETHNLKSITIGHSIYYIENINTHIHKKKLIAFMPGSRIGEIESLFRYFEIAYKQLLMSEDNIEIFIPTLPHLKKLIDFKVKHWKIKTLIVTDDKKIEYNYLKTKFALVCSGTASIELTKRQIPQLVIYKFNFFTELILSFFVKIRFANIINIIENKMIIPELVNSNLKKNIFIKQFNYLLNNSVEQTKQINLANISLKKIQKIRAPHNIIIDEIKKYL